MKRVLRWLGLMPGFPSAEMALLLLVFAEGGLQPEIQPKRMVDEYSKQKLGASSTCHILCRCRFPRSDEIIPHG